MIQLARNNVHSVNTLNVHQSHCTSFPSTVSSVHDTSHSLTSRALSFTLTSTPLFPIPPTDPISRRKRDQVISPEPQSSFNLLQQEATDFQACSVVLPSISQFRNSAPSDTPLHHAFDQISLSLLLDFAWFTYAELKPLLSSSNYCLKDLLFMDIALDSTVRTTTERSYEELKKAKPEVSIFTEEMMCSGSAASLSSPDVLSHVSV
ncbi:hypothetical protein L2E82_08808 [Cichorium intybus]|uniref:Uncharacterized protein n=1 Tax=Cichorium intybus TaxID=13427 RepID=A0ACB9G808_CICIN|nr:hypothetical protein L2E82_08808 [Cichorium intybus]